MLVIFVFGLVLLMLLVPACSLVTVCWVFVCWLVLVGLFVACTDGVALGVAMGSCV